MAEKRAETKVLCLLQLSPSLLCPFKVFSFSPAAQFIVAVAESCNHLSLMEPGGGEEARGGEKELVSALGAGPTTGIFLCIEYGENILCICTVAAHVNAGDQLFMWQLRT